MYSQKFINSFDGLNKIGLTNLGNTCYINAALQALYNCERLKFFYLKCPLSLISSKNPCLSELFKDLIIQLSSDRPRHSIRPYEILERMRRVNHTFRGFQQQDSQEFLRAFLYEIHDELKFTPIPDLHYIPRSRKQVHFETLRLSSKVDFMDDEMPSVIMDIFQGSTISIVECLTCSRKSQREEIFIDISVPISSPKRKKSLMSTSTDQEDSTLSSHSQNFAMNSFNDIFIYFLHWFLILTLYIRAVPNKLLTYSKKSIQYLLGGSDLHLTDCLESFFSEDELTGENSYHCKNCNMACNGIKSTRLFRTPEVLCIHIKRFRNDLMNSSKVCTPVLFPLYNLDLSPYLIQKFDNEISRQENVMYDLSAVICHLGSSSNSGHYITMAYNSNAGCWLEYDDDIVTEVDTETVLSCVSTAYVLIYSKQTNHMRPIINHAEKLNEQALRLSDGSSYYVSKSWLVKLSTFSNPGPMTTHEFLCPHEKFQPTLWEDRSKFVSRISSELWNYLYSTFGTHDPIIQDLAVCQKCLTLIHDLNGRRDEEYDKFLELMKTQCDSNRPLCAINSTWFNTWRDFVQSNLFKPPGPIDNSKISSFVSLYWNPFHQNQNYELIFESCWDYLQSIYGGGPKFSLSRDQPSLDIYETNLELSKEEDLQEPQDVKLENIESETNNMKTEILSPQPPKHFPAYRSHSADRISTKTQRIFTDHEREVLHTNDVEMTTLRNGSINSSAYWSNDESSCSVIATTEQIVTLTVKPSLSSYGDSVIDDISESKLSRETTQSHESPDVKSSAAKKRKTRAKKTKNCDHTNVTEVPDTN